MNKKRRMFETRGLIKRYLSQGLTQTEIARVLGITRQGVSLYVKQIRGRNRNG